MKKDKLEVKIKALERKVQTIEYLLILRKEEHKPNALQGFTLGFSIATMIFIIAKQFF